jgi:hypothetical protein
MRMPVRIAFTVFDNLMAVTQKSLLSQAFYFFRNGPESGQIHKIMERLQLPAPRIKSFS